MSRLTGYWREELGSAAEFALVLIPFSMLIFMILHLGLMFYANENLQYAAEAAARCYSVDSTNCGTTANAAGYASARYKGPNIGASFLASYTALPAGCGHKVTGTGTYQVDALLVHRSVTLRAASCFP
jgi:Flp pilus assembly protein TadG